ncbi:class I SAM-dependent RNA methyltransferase [Candidatus Saccharibacteria bacterium]|nr:class I SAM-dependent RNA methyltransferase [Candidatus Saccharibacteria bacterium]
MQITSLVPGGQALTTLNDPTNPAHGKKLFLWNALPGELVTDFQLTKKKSSYLEGIATKISRPSKYRTEPKDACFLSTSPWQIMTYPFELEQKRLLVAESLRQAHIDLDRLATSGVAVAPVKTDGIEWGYRNKMEYALYWDHSDQKIYLAFHTRGTHQKLPLKPLESSENAEKLKTLPSSIERPEIAQKALKIVQELNSQRAEARTYQSLLLRCNQQGIISGGLLENHQPHPVFPNLEDKILEKPYSYSPNGFFQINLPVYELALEEIKSHINTDKVLDLYAGVGTIGLSVASDRHLTLVESNPAAFGELVMNVRRIEQCAGAKSPDVAHRGGHDRAIAAETRNDGLEDGGDTNGASRKAQNRTIIPLARNKYSNSPKAFLAKSEDCLSFIEPNQTVILDPPRAGCDKKLLERLLEITPKTIIYLSCNPSTQARDVAILTNAEKTALTTKYKITKISPYNFFPKTPHIENLIILEQ